MGVHNEDLAGCSNVLGDSCIVFITCLMRRKRWFLHYLREFSAGYQRNSDADANTRHGAFTFAFTHANANQQRHGDQ